MSPLSYQGPKIGSMIELHYFDSDGPIFIYLPKEGLESLCGRSLPDERDVRLILLSVAEKELFQIIDRAIERCGGFMFAYFENGACFRKLSITMADIDNSGIKISTDVLAAAARSGFVDLQTGLLSH